MMRRLMLLLLSCGILAACADDSPALPPGDGALRAETAAGPAVVEVKFHPRPAGDGGDAAAADASPARAAGAGAVLDGYGPWQLHRLVPTPPAPAAALAGAAGGEAAPDLSRWYQVVLPAGSSVEQAAARLRALPGVEYAYPAPRPAPPPATPDLVPHQGYFGGPPQGTASRWSHNVPGGRGDGVTVVDVELDWYLSHEDLNLPPGAWISGERSTTVGPDHGTAVLGILAARDNGFGVTGGVPNATVRVVSPLQDGFYRPAAAIAAAVDATRPGDVILLEQQALGPEGEFIPLEGIQSVFDATRAATLAGRIVVAPVGNSNNDLDHERYQGAFNRTVRNSGAILVGGGNSFHSRIYWSCYGSRVDLQGWGLDVATTGYGGLFGTSPTDAYTRSFGGTSGAAAIVAAAVVAVQGRRKALGLPVFTAAEVVALLRETGSPQHGLTGQNIGPFPDLYRAMLAIRTAPTTPPALTATPVSGRSVALAWSAATGHVQYLVQRTLRGPDGAFGPPETVATPWAVETGYVDTGLTPGAAYRYQIAACDAVRCAGWRFSPVVTLPVVPAPPESLKSTMLSGTSVRLDWTDASANEGAFQVWRRERPAGGEWGAFAQVATVGRDAVRHTDTGLVPGTGYQYRVQACNVAGCSQGAFTGTLVAPVTPAAPGAVVLTPLTGTSVQVGWTDLSGNESRFDVHRRAQNPDGSWTPLAPVASPGANAVAVVDAGVAAGTRYRYAVRACNGPACSPWVDGPLLLMPVFPPVPGSLRVVQSAVTGVRLGWTDGGTSETGFRVERRVRNPDGTYAPWAFLATAPADATGFTDTAVVPGGRYLYRVSACNRTACSAWTAQVSAAVPAG